MLINGPVTSDFNDQPPADHGSKYPLLQFLTIHLKFTKLER